VWQGAAGETHRREIEESLRQSENKYRLLAETAREIILLFDSNLCITYANTAWKRISGYLPEEMTEVNITDLIPVPQRSQFAARLERIHDNQADDYLLLETNFILKDHRMITVEATIARMESADNSPAFLMTVRDITERKGSRPRPGCGRNS